MKGSLVFATNTAKLRKTIAVLSMYQNASLIDDLEFEIEGDELKFCQSDDLIHMTAKASIPLTFFDKFEITGDVDKFVLPVRKIITSIDSMFSEYKKMLIKIVFEDDGSHEISLTSKREAYKVKGPELPRINKDEAVKLVERFSKFKTEAVFKCEATEIVNIGYNDNTTIAFTLSPPMSPDGTARDDLLYISSESDLSGTKYAKKVSVNDLEVNVRQLTYKYNLEYLKHVLINQEGELIFTLLEKGILRILQEKPFEALFYIAPLD